MVLILLYLIRKDRGARGGGVATAYDTRKARFKKYPIQNNRYEIVCATGKVNNNSRKIAIFSVYLPPKQTASSTKEIAACIADSILKLKSELNDTIIVVGGDMNRKCIEGAFVESPDIPMHCPIATRGDAALDLVYSNISSHVEYSLPPLSSDEGP